MSTKRRNRTLIWIAVAALVCVNVALVDEAFFHTDDGCDVEVHCVACRLLAGTTGVVSPIVVIAFEIRAAAPLAPRSETLPAPVTPRPSSSRAPPLAS
jgi:hypothetical protein